MMHAHRVEGNEIWHFFFLFFLSILDFRLGSDLGEKRKKHSLTSPDALLEVHGE